MSKILLKAWLLSPAVLGASLVAPTAAFAELPMTEAQPTAIAAATQTPETPESTEIVQEPTQPELSISEKVTVTPVDTLTLGQPQQLSQVPVNPHAGGVEPSRGIETRANTEIPVADLDAAPQPETSTNGEVIQQLNQYGREGRGNKRQAQVTSVSQLSDVQPTDWAFQALQSLVERYGCIAGYPDGTYKGNRALTRFEFAAGVNACLERINELINASTSDLVTREDLAKLQALMEEFAAELASLRGRVIALESRAGELEANQFSTTTKLRGEVLFFAADGEGDRATDNVLGTFAPEEDDPVEAYLGYRVRLNFDTSFTGRDLLRTRFQAQDLPVLSDFDLYNTQMARTIIDGGQGQRVYLDTLAYRFPISNGKGLVWIGAQGLALDDVQDVLTPFGDEGSGSISRFGRSNPTSFRGPDGTGVGLEYAFNSKIKLNVGYLADGAFAPDPREGRGIFNGNHSAMAQLVFVPRSNLGFAIDYNRRYFAKDNVYVTGGTGSWIANRPFGDNATTTDNLGFQANWRVARSFSLGGWFGASWANQRSGGDADATIINWAVVLGFPDVLREGDTGALIVGMPPKVTSHDIGALEDNDTSIHIEGFYRFPFSEYISITPGFYVVTNPEHNEDNNTIVVGTLRTQFRF